VGRGVEFFKIKRKKEISSAGRKEGRDCMIWSMFDAEETDNPDGICDDCKFCIITDKDIHPTF
jgi:hypothetical protein